MSVLSNAEMDAHGFEVDVSILIVSWNVRDLLLRCLASVPVAADPLSYEIIVVDNASDDGTLASLSAAFPEVRVIANTQNRGFSGGNNQALATAVGAYLFLLNPDTELRSGAITALHHYLETHAQVGIVGPRLRYGDGTLQASRRRFPSLATLFSESTIIQEYMPGIPLFAHFYISDRSPDRAQPVDWIMGAADVVRRVVYEQIGGLDERFFMYSEELDWCRRAVAAGWQVAYEPAAEVVHFEGKVQRTGGASPPYPFFPQSCALYTQILRRFLG